MAVETFLNTWCPWAGQIGSKFGQSAFDGVQLMLMVLGDGHLMQSGYPLQMLGSPTLSHPGGGGGKTSGHLGRTRSCG